MIRVHAESIKKIKQTFWMENPIENGRKDGETVANITLRERGEERGD